MIYKIVNNLIGIPADSFVLLLYTSTPHLHGTLLQDQCSLIFILSILDKDFEPPEPSYTLLPFFEERILKRT